jgi:hypothetical protein
VTDVGWEKKDEGEERGWEAAVFIMKMKVGDRWRGYSVYFPSF